MKIDEELKNIESMTRCIDDIAMALSRVGSIMLAEELITISEEILESAKFIRTENSDIINERFNQSQESSANLLKGILGGIQLGIDSKKE